MSLLEKIQSDVKTAMKAKDEQRLNTLRFLTSQVNNRQIEKGKDASLTEDEVMDVLRREIKKRKEAADLYRQGGRTDLAESEEAEMRIIMDYLPAAPTEEDVRKVIAELKAGGIAEFPALMKEAMAKLKGADGALVAKIAKEQ